MSNLNKNASNDDLLVAVLLAQYHDKSLAAETLSNALNKMNKNPLLLSVAIYHCVLGFDTTFCENNELYKKIIELDPDNLEPYIYYAVRLMEEENNSRALSMLNRGLEARRHNSYYFEKMKVIIPRLKSMGYPEKRINVATEIYADPFTWYSIYNRILKGCPELSVASDK